MANLVLFMHVSLDGFVAGPNGEMDWIHVDDEIFDYGGKRIAGTSTALYGRVTYEMMEGYWPTAAEQPKATKHDIEHAAWYKKAHKLVLSRSLEGKQLENTTILSGNHAEQLNRIKKETEGDILMFGSPGASHVLMAEGLIDELWLFVNPILLGEGIPLFKNSKEKQKLALENTHTFTTGVQCVQYRLLQA